MVVVCLSIFILLFGIFSVSASDNTVNINDNLTNMESNTYDDLKMSNQNFEDEKLNDGIEYNFEDLQNKIDAAYAGGELNLDAGDLYNNTDSNLITISNALTINGNGATISGATSFTVSGGNVVLKNIRFINFKDNGIRWNGDDGILSNCTFVDNTANYGGSLYWVGENGVLNNCTFINSVCTGSSTSYGGGAVYWQGDYGVLGNCSFVNSATDAAGSAVYWVGVNGTLYNSTFINSYSFSEDLMGTIFWDAGYGVLSNCSFFNNTAHEGGAVYWYGSYGVLGNCSFVNNSASYGGAVYWSTSSSHSALSNCSFVNNSASDGGAVFWDVDNSALSNCSFVNNSASDGGAVYWVADKGNMNNCSFVNNSASNGGAVYYNSEAYDSIYGILWDCDFINNKASSGSAIYGKCNFEVDDCYFDRNLGQGIYLETNCNISNCIFNMTKIYIASGKVRLIYNYELSYQNNFTTNYGELFLYRNDLMSCIYNMAKITSPVTMIALNNQTVNSSSDKINITALIYDDNKNIIVDDDLRICVGSSEYEAVFDGVNYTAFDCDVPEIKSVVSVKIQRSNNYENITFKNGLLSPAPQNLTVNVDFDVAENDVLILFNVTPTNFKDNLTVFVYNNEYSVNITGGKGNLSVRNLPVGNYMVVVYYPGSVKFNQYINLFNFTINLLPSQVNITVSDHVGSDVVVFVNVTSGATGTVLIDVNGTQYYRILDNSRAQLVLNNLNPGDYPVRVIYMGNDKYSNSTNQTDFIVSEGVVVSVFMDGKNPMLNVTLPEDGAGNVTVTINNKNYTGVVDNRHAIINISDVSPNTYNITTSYTNSSGAIVKVNTTITVPKPLLIATVINVEHISNDLMVTAVLKDIDGNVLANENITYSMNGVINNTATDADGLFKVKYVSNSNLYIEYAGNNIYNGFNTTIVVDKFVDLRNATKIISDIYYTYAVDFYIGERGGYFKFRLVDENGNALANKPVQIGFCGVVYNSVTDSEGYAQLQINLNTPFIFTFAIAFLGDDTHNASFVVQQINVAKKTTKIFANPKTFKAGAKTKRFTVTLKSDKCSSIDGKSYLGSGKKITLKLNGKTYAAKTNANNQATFKLSINKKGTYNAEIRFDGDVRYAASKTTAKIKII